MDKSYALRRNAKSSNHAIIEELRKNNPSVRVKGRVKEADSMVGKVARQPEKYKDVGELNDVSGVRATAKDIRGVQDTIDYVRNTYDVISEKNNIDEDRGGYRSYHAIVKKNGVMSEIQIRTERQDTWANWTHDNFYKPSNQSKMDFLNSNIAEINKYSLGMSDYFYKKDTGDVKASKPECPPSISQVVGCL